MGKHFKMASLLSARGCRQIFTSQLRSVTISRVARATTAEEEKKMYWDRNLASKRPVSPHMFIYRPQITWILSITHRGTGVGLSCALTALGVSSLVMNQNFEACLHALQATAYGPSLLVATKMLLAWPICYHSLNGIRHLFWDMGRGFEMKTLNMTGWTVVVGSVLGAVLLTMLPLNKNDDSK